MVCKNKTKQPTNQTNNKKINDKWSDYTLSQGQFLI